MASYGIPAQFINGIATSAGLLDPSRPYDPVTNPAVSAGTVMDPAANTQFYNHPDTLRAIRTGDTNLLQSIAAGINTAPIHAQNLRLQQQEAARTGQNMNNQGANPFAPAWADADKDLQRQYTQAQRNWEAAGMGGAVGGISGDWRSWVDGNPNANQPPQQSFNIGTGGAWQGRQAPPPSPPGNSDPFRPAQSWVSMIGGVDGSNVQALPQEQWYQGTEYLAQPNYYPTQTGYQWSQMPGMGYNPYPQQPYRQAQRNMYYPQQPHRPQQPQQQQPNPYPTQNQGFNWNQILGLDKPAFGNMNSSDLARYAQQYAGNFWGQPVNSSWAPMGGGSAQPYQPQSNYNNLAGAYRSAPRQQNRGNNTNWLYY
jgi:hypothetical protein